MLYTRDELERRVEAFRAKAIEEHAVCRKWQPRALEAEERLANCTCTSQQQPREES